MADRTLEEQLAEIPSLDAVTLAGAWGELFGDAPPRTISRRLLELAAAYQAQAVIYGGVSKATRRKLTEAARQRAAGPERQMKRRISVSPGARLVREWRGRSHVVDVTEHGFLYAGETYRSLSEVARVITGARWSGRRFFGL